MVTLCVLRVSHLDKSGGACLLYGCMRGYSCATDRLYLPGLLAMPYGKRHVQT